MKTDVFYDDRLLSILQLREGLKKSRNFLATSPLDYRYVNGELTPFFSEEAKFLYWGLVEGSSVLTLAERGLVENEISLKIISAIQKVKAETVYLFEYGDKGLKIKGLKHDVRAYLKALCVELPEVCHPYTHAFQTSYDKIDTANAARLRDAILEVIIPNLQSVIKKLIRFTRDFAKTVQVGRTHLQHASPVTFGFAMAEYVERLGQQLLELERVAKNLKGKFSGPVGTFGPASLIVKDVRKLEREVLQKMGLKPSPYSNQILIPEYALDVYCVVTKIAGIMANLGDDMRRLEATEISEIKEASGNEEGASSVMPHKINPITWENIKSIFKELMGRLTTRFLDLISEHQRDLTNSASGRFAFEMVDLLLVSIKGADRILDGITVDAERMIANLGLTKDQIISDPLNTILRWLGHPDAHEVAGQLSKAARLQNCTIYELLLKDENLAPYVKRMTPGHRLILSDPKLYTGQASQIALRTALKWERKLKLVV